MLTIRLSGSTDSPLFRQIVDQVKMAIARGELGCGDHLPPVRSLASRLDVSPGTVARAFHELAREGVVVTRQGGGTVVDVRPDDPPIARLRKNRLSGIMSQNILQALSLGYHPDELESSFLLQLSRWREERRAGGRDEEEPADRSHVHIVGSHDLALELLVEQVRNRYPRFVVAVDHAGSLGGLIALQEHRADIAGIHLLDEETGTYNDPYVKHILPGMPVVIVHLADRIQGIMYAEGNPKGVSGLQDLVRKDVTFINRQQGAGTRILLDFKLRENGIDPADVIGYETEVDTHLAVADAIASGKADLGLGIEAAARRAGTGFTPLFGERYDLVVTFSRYTSEQFTPLMDTMVSPSFRNAVEEIGGYDMSGTGDRVFVNCEDPGRPSFRQQC